MSANAIRQETGNGIMSLPKMAPIDAIDEQIINQLAQNARATYADIGAIVRLSAPAVKRRVDRLLAAKIITGFTTRVNYDALGGATEGYVELYCRDNTSPAELARILEQVPEVVSACTVTGAADAVLLIRTTDTRRFESVVERINAASAVLRTHSMIVMAHLVRPGRTPERTASRVGQR